MHHRRFSTGRPCATGGQRGSALLEFALVLPIVLALIGAIIDGGWALHQAALITAAAEAAQRAVALQDTGSGHCTGAAPGAYADVSAAAAAAAAPTLNASSIAVAVRYLEPACNGRMRTLVVDMACTLHALTPWFAGLLNGRRLTAEAAGAVEELPPPWWGAAAQVQLDQAQISALQSAYQGVLSAYQAEASLAAALSQSAAYYYSQWLQFAGQGASDGTHEQ